jgi:hypothetical protein
MAAAVTALMASIVGFGAGLSLFRRSLSWCRTCGSVLICADRARGRL